MPKKIVYGKKRNGERQAWGKFLSPEKKKEEQLHDAAGTQPEVDVDVLEKGLQGLGLEEKAVKQRSRSRQKEQNCENAEQISVPEEKNGTRKKSRSRKEGETNESANLVEDEPGQEGAVQKKSRPRRDDQDHSSGSTKENTVPEEDDLEQALKSLTVDDPAKEDHVVQKKPGRPRKVLSDRDLNAVVEATPKPQDAPKAKAKKRIEPMQITHVGPSEPMGTAKPRPSLAAESQLPTPEPTPEPQDLYSRYTFPLLALSDRRRIITFQDWSDELEPHFEVTKIAEASFSEVYRLSSTSATNGIKQESVLKVVPLKTAPDAPLPCQLLNRAIRNREAQMAKELEARLEEDHWRSDVMDVASEVKLLQNTTHIPGFTVFRDLTIVQGRPSASFSFAWKDWNKTRTGDKKSQFPDPSKKTSYTDTQLWAVIEMQDAGTDVEKMMENGGLTSIWEVWDVFWGVVVSVAKAEEECRFEHRDLHLGNICVRSSRAGADVLHPIIKDPLKRKLKFSGLETTVIDYTLSRADIASGKVESRAEAGEGNDEDVEVAFLDLNKDPALFQGDASEEYQYEIYRYMRGAALFGDPLQGAWEPEEEEQEQEQEQEQEPEPEEEEEEEEEESQNAPVAPKKNTHIRFDAEEEEDTSIKPSTPSSQNALASEQPEEAGEEEVEVEDEDANPWRTFHPQTNLVWLHFLLHKLLHHLPTPPHKLSLKQTMQPIAHPEAFHGEEQKVKRKAIKLHKVLQKVADLLCPVALGREDGLGSAGELVVQALEERWVRVGDVAG
jgi:serine/threonine-protein kinase haspin